MNKQTAVKLLRQHFSLFDIQSWMGDCSFIDKVAIEVYKELAGKSSNNPDDIVDPSTNTTAGRLLSTQAYEWASEFVMAKLRFDNRPREDFEPQNVAVACLKRLIRLRIIEENIDAGVATEEDKAWYRLNQRDAWADAKTWFNTING